MLNVNIQDAFVLIVSKHKKIIPASSSAISFKNAFQLLEETVIGLLTRQAKAAPRVKINT